MILGASYDDAAANKHFADKFSFPFRLLCDVDRKLAAAYGANDAGEPDYPRRISYLIGPDGKIVKGYDPVKPAAHPDEVLADLSKL